MRYQIIWRSASDNALIDLWMAANDRREFAEAVDRLEETLKRDPNAAGESRDEFTRVVFCGPLAVYMQVDERRNIVFVESIWQVR